MTKIPSVEERVEEFSIVNDYPVDIGGWILPYTHQLTEKQKNWLTQTLTADRLALLTELREWADSRIKPQEHGPDCLGEFCDSAYCNWEYIYKTNTEMALLKAHLDELIKSTSL